MAASLPLRTGWSVFGYVLGIVAVRVGVGAGRLCVVYGRRVRGVIATGRVIVVDRT